MYPSIHPSNPCILASIHSFIPQSILCAPFHLSAHPFPPRHHHICIMYATHNCTSFSSIDPTIYLSIYCSVLPSNHNPSFTLSLSMASSLPGVNMIRSCKLVMDPARLERAEREGEGLIPVIALVTVKRSRL